MEIDGNELIESLKHLIGDLVVKNTIQSLQIESLTQTESVDIPLEKDNAVQSS